MIEEHGLAIARRPVSVREYGHADEFAQPGSVLGLVFLVRPLRFFFATGDEECIIDDIVGMLPIPQETTSEVTHRRQVLPKLGLGKTESVAQSNVERRPGGVLGRGGRGAGSWFEVRRLHPCKCEKSVGLTQKIFGIGRFLGSKGVLVAQSTMRRWGQRVWLGACVGVITLIGASTATAGELPHHRFDFKADASLPWCNQPLEFFGLLGGVVPPSTFDAPTTRSLVVRIRQKPNGGKAVDIEVKDDATGATLGKKHQEYRAAIECFKVLYFTAMDAGQLIEDTAPPEPKPEPEPPSDPRPEPCPPVSTACPACPTPAPPKARAETTPAPDASSARVFVGGGVATYWNLAPAQFIAPRALVGFRVLPHFVIEAEFAFEAWLRANPNNGPTAVDVDTYLGSLAGCAKLGWFMPCGVLVGGALRVTTVNRRYPMTNASPFFGGGMRVAAEAIRSDHFSWRADVDILAVSPPSFAPKTWSAWEPKPSILSIALGTSVIWNF